MTIGQTFPPAGSFEEHDVEKNRWRIPTMPHLHPRPPMYTPVDTHRPHPDIPVLTTFPARPHPGTHAASSGLFPAFP